MLLSVPLSHCLIVGECPAATIGRQAGLRKQGGPEERVGCTPPVRWWKQSRSCTHTPSGKESSMTSHRQPPPPLHLHSPDNSSLTSSHHLTCVPECCLETQTTWLGRVCLLLFRTPEALGQWSTAVHPLSFLMCRLAAWLSMHQISNAMAKNPNSSEREKDRHLRL